MKTVSEQMGISYKSLSETFNDLHDSIDIVDVSGL